MNLDKKLINHYITTLKNDMNSKNHEVVYTVGEKYVKVVVEDWTFPSNSGRKNAFVHSFIVDTIEDNKFKMGDILKPASFNSPTRNFSRGNLFVPLSYSNHVKWTGV